MREVHRVKVIDFLPANRFEKVLQGELNKLSEEGFKVETEIKMTNSRFFSAVLIGKKETLGPFFVDAEIQVNGEVIARGAYAHLETKEEEKLPKFLKEMQADKAAMEFYKHGTLPSEQDKPE